MNYLTILLVINLIWLVIITVIIFRVRRHYHRLITWSKKESLTGIIETIIEKYDLLEKNQHLLKQELEQTIAESQFHFRKVGLVRFNPFERVGGEQSFIIALIDKKDNGVVITFLYTRDGVRVYTKKLVNGKSPELELSDEERTAIKKAS